MQGGDIIKGPVNLSVEAGPPLIAAAVQAGQLGLQLTHLHNKIALRSEFSISSFFTLRFYMHVRQYQFLKVRSGSTHANGILFYNNCLKIKA